MFQVQHRVPHGTFGPHPPALTNEARQALEAAGVRIRMQTTGHRPYIEAKGKLCSKCHLAPPEPKQRYCKACHAAAQRKSARRKKDRMAAMKAALADHGIIIEDAP
jgi:hypothetical protein